MNTLIYKTIFVATWAVEIILGLRFMLKIFAANPLAPFVSWIYGISSIFFAPFSGIFPVYIQNGSIFEFSTLFAILVYGLVGYGLMRLAMPKYPYVCDPMTGVCRKVGA